MTSAYSLLLRILRVVCILIYLAAMCSFVTSVAALFFPTYISVLHSLFVASIALMVAFGTLCFLRYAAHKTAPADYQPPTSYNTGVIFIFLGGLASWAIIFFPSIDWVIGWVLFATIISGLYILFKVRTFHWRFFVIIGLGFGLAMAPFTLVAMVAKARHSQAEQTTTESK